MPFDKYQEEVVKPQIRRRLDQLRKQYGQQKIVNADPEKMKLLVARLRDEDNETYIKSALALGDSREKWAILPLAEVYYGWRDDDCLAYWPSWKVQFAIGLALLELGEAKELVACLSNDSGFINPSRWKKFKVDESGRERVADALIRLLTAPAIGVAGARYWAARALGMLGEQRAVEPLMERLRKHPASVDLRTALVDALGELGDTRAVEILELLVKSDCEKKSFWKKTVSECAARAIEKIKQQ